VWCGQEIVLDSKTNKVWGVLLQDGSYVKADAVVCNADAPWAYNNLLPATPYAKKVDQLEYTASTISFYWYQPLIIITVTVTVITHIIFCFSHIPRVVTNKGVWIVRCLSCRRTTSS
jgi:hypothetical protein